ncbi:MAG: hypothetical protein RBT19_01975 [Tenuifilaceae bacterium]|nr:hypothetical protein [Tenuifilaceae bacterium]
MKNFLFVTITACSIMLNVHLSYGQDDSERNRDVVIYSFFVNFVPDGFNYPLIGFVNNAMGNHKGVHVGFVNTNFKDFEGIQVGFVNSVLANTKGAQVGFVNTSLNSLTGIQVGFVNFTKSASNSPQIGFVNSASKLNGFQLGFVNYVDSLESGIPLGFVSIVRKGGYRAVELFASEMHPVNLSFKIGVKPLYTFITGSYGGNGDRLFEYGFGVGSIIDINNKLFFNPEIKSVSSPKLFNTHYYSFTPRLGYVFTEHLYMAAGPSIVWNYNEELHPMANPSFSLAEHTAGQNHRLIVGARLAIGARF